MNKNFVSLAVIILSSFVSFSTLFAEKKSLDDYTALKMIELTDEYRVMVSDFDIEPLFTRIDEFESLVVEYILLSNEAESYYSIIFVLDTTNVEIKDKYRAYTKYGSTLYESLNPSKISPLQNSCNYWTCTQTKTIIRFLRFLVVHMS